MGYIITATFPVNDDLNHKDCLERILKNDFVRHLSTDSVNEYETVDMRGEFGEKADLTKKLCNALVNSGIYRFEIGHSY
jgi:hypothetical protein